MEDARFTIAARGCERRLLEPKPVQGIEVDWQP